MDPIAPTQSAAVVANQSSVQEAVTELGSDVFLRLLVTQLQSQDPTSPVQNEDFVAQLAQFTTLEQTTNTNELLEQMIGKTTQQSEMDLVNLVDRTIGSEGDTVSLGEADEPVLAYALSDQAGKVSVEVLGTDNQIVRSIHSEGLKETGGHQVVWDGLDDDGDRVPEGVYQFRIKAHDLNNQPVSALTFARERVTNIVLGTENPIMVQSGKALKTEDIISIQ